MGLAGVISTQLWHHLYCGGGLCDLPSWTPLERGDALESVSVVADGATAGATVT
jgi:hypothetical protein